MSLLSLRFMTWVSSASLAVAPLRFCAFFIRDAKVFVLLSCWNEVVLTLCWGGGEGGCGDGAGGDCGWALCMCVCV